MGEKVYDVWCLVDPHKRYGYKALYRVDAYGSVQRYNDVSSIGNAGWTRSMISAGDVYHLRKIGDSNLHTRLVAKNVRFK